jgi:hypothetical protein
MYMRKFTQGELLNESIWDKVKGALKVAGKGAVAAAKGTAKMVSPTGVDILRNVKTAVQTGVNIFTKEQANIIARKYLQDKYESTGSMFNIKEIGQSKGSLLGQLVPLTSKEKQEEAKTNQTQTTNTSTGVPPKSAVTPSTTTNTSVTEQTTDPKAMRLAPPPVNKQQVAPEAPQETQNKLQAQSDEKNWPFRVVFFEADVLPKIAQTGKKVNNAPTSEKFIKMKFGVKLTKTVKDGEKEWTVLGLVNPDGTKFTGIEEVKKDNMKVADAPVSFKKKPKQEVTVGMRVKWQDKKGNIKTGKIIENLPDSKIDPKTTVTIKPDRGGITTLEKSKIIKEGLTHRDVISKSREKLF